MSDGKRIVYPTLYVYVTKSQLAHKTYKKVQTNMFCRTNIASNIYAFQEMDSIVDQMMTVAEYIGWETKELRPVRNLNC